MKWWWLCVLLIATALPQVTSAQLNAGFVEGLWYSKPAVFADEPVRVYIAVRNNTDSDLTGRVEFFANGERFGRMNVSALNGRIVEAWADWTPTYGEHTLSASLSRIELEAVGSGGQPATVTAALAEDVLFVDFDTDGDGVGNVQDIDDDGDGYTDNEELEAGTDPLVPEAPEEADTTVSSETESAELRATSSSAVGLEQYLTENRASVALRSVTDLVNASKERVDGYRAARADARSVREPSEEPAPDVPSPDIDLDLALSTSSATATLSHIGTITRSPHEPGIVVRTVSAFWGALMGVLSFGLDAVLFALSSFLAHPILVQVTLLILALFLMLKLAQRFSRREY